MLEFDEKSLTYATFRDKCLRPNVPAVIRASRVGPPCTDFFNVAKLRQSLSPDALCEMLGPTHLLPVDEVPNTCRVSQGKDAAHGTGAGKGSEPEEDCRHFDMPLVDVLHSWAAAAADGTRASTSPAESLLYLRDWHLQRTLETAPAAQKEPLYRVPPYLGADWMDAFCRAVGRSMCTDDRKPPLVGFGDKKSDYRFSYIGMPGTWTKLHYDVFGTYSWSFNVCGEKLWYFPTPASNAHILASHARGLPLPPDIRVMDEVEYFTVVQQPGDLVFVPSQYLHQVHNISGDWFPLAVGAAGAASRVELTVSLNHNWCNAFCIERMVTVFLQDVATLQRYLTREDVCAACGSSEAAQVRAFADNLLRSSTNWNFSSMLSFLSFCEDLCSTTREPETENQQASELLRQLVKRVSLAQSELFIS